jgi:hypothetical protein
MLRRSPGQEDGFHPVSTRRLQAQEGMHKARLTVNFVLLRCLSRIRE